MDYLKKFDKLVERDCLEYKKYKNRELSKLNRGVVKKDVYGNIITKDFINKKQYISLLEEYGAFKKMEDASILDDLFTTLLSTYTFEQANTFLMLINNFNWNINDIQNAYASTTGNTSQATNFNEAVIEFASVIIPPFPSVTEEVGIIGGIGEVLERAGEYNPYPVGYDPELPTQREEIVGEVQRTQQETLEGRPTQLYLTGKAGRPQSTLMSGETFQLELPPIRYVYPTLTKYTSPPESFLYGFE